MADRFSPDIVELVTDELLAHGEFSSGANNRSNAREAARVVVDMVRSHSSAAIDRTPAAVIRLLTKIANLVDDEDACEPLDDAIRYANEAIALINDPAQPKPDPRLTDNDAGEISVTVDGKEVRGWSYKDDTERRTKMLAAREYVEGWCDGRDA